MTAPATPGADPQPFAPPGAVPGAAPVGAPLASPYAAPAAGATPPGAPPYAAPTGPGPRPPMGAPPFGPPPSAMQRPAERTGLATASLVIGVCSLLGSLVSVGLLGLVGVVGAVLAAVALRRADRGTGGGRSRAVGGLFTSMVAVVFGILLLLTFGPAALESFQEGLEAGWAAGRGEAGDVASTDGGTGPGDDAWDAAYDHGYDIGWYDGYEAAENQNVIGVRTPPAGDVPWTRDELPVAALGEPVALGLYTVRVTAIEVDGDEAVEAALPANPAPLGRYVLATLAVTNDGDAPGRPAIDLLVSYWGEDEQLYDDWRCRAWTARPSLEVGPVAPGATVEYDVCMEVPTAALDDWSVIVEDMTERSDSPVRWVAER